MTIKRVGHRYIDSESGKTLDVWFPRASIKQARSCLAQKVGLIKSDFVELEIDIEEAHKFLPKEMDTESEEDPLEKKFKFLTDGGVDKVAKEIQDYSDEESEQDEKAKRINKMAYEIEAFDK